MTFHPENVSQFEGIFKKNEKAISEQPGCSHVELVIDLNHPLVRAKQFECYFDAKKCLAKFGLLQSNFSHRLRRLLLI